MLILIFNSGNSKYACCPATKDTKYNYKYLCTWQHSVTRLLHASDDENLATLDFLQMIKPQFCISRHVTMQLSS